MELLPHNNVTGLLAVGMRPVWLAVMDAHGASVRLGRCDGCQAHLIVWSQGHVRDGVQDTRVLIRGAAPVPRVLLLGAVIVVVVGVALPVSPGGTKDSGEPALVEGPNKQRAEGRQAAGDNAYGRLDAGPDEDVAFCPADILCFGEVGDRFDPDDGGNADTKIGNNGSVNCVLSPSLRKPNRLQAAKEKNKRYSNLLRAWHVQLPHGRCRNGENTHVAKQVDDADTQVELRFVHRTIAAAARVELEPVIWQWFAVEWEHNVVRDQVAGGEEDTPPCHPRHPKDPTVEEEDGRLDHGDTPRVDEHIGEGDLER